MSPYRAALIRWGYGEWAFSQDGAAVRVAREFPLQLCNTPRMANTKRPAPKRTPAKSRTTPRKTTARRTTS